MPNSVTLTHRVSVLGDLFDVSGTLDVDAATRIPKSLDAAKTGQLTTRTDNDTGTLTMDGGHGIITGDRLDVYWDGGRRYGMTVGTVATNSVPIDGGSGDNLPANLTNITAMVPASETWVATAGDVNLIAAKCGSGNFAGTVVLTQSDDTFITALRVGGNDDVVSADAWYSGFGATPVGANVGKVFFSHGDSTATRELVATLGKN